jgi:hypothetical protein
MYRKTERLLFTLREPSLRLTDADASRFTRLETIVCRRDVCFRFEYFT